MADITRETIESLAEKLETLAASLPPEERAVLVAALSKAEADVKGYGGFTGGLSPLLASAVGLRAGTSIPAAQVAGRGTFIQLKGVIRGSKV